MQAVVRINKLSMNPTVNAHGGYAGHYIGFVCLFSACVSCLECVHEMCSLTLCLSLVLFLQVISTGITSTKSSINSHRINHCMFYGAVLLVITFSSIWLKQMLHPFSCVFDIFDRPVPSERGTFSYDPAATGAYKMPLAYR